jgi:hypothetical protein
MFSNQRGNYPPGTESIAGWAWRVTGTPTAGDGRAGYYTADNGFGVGEDTTDSFIFLRKGGTEETVYRSDWNGDYNPDSRAWVNDQPVIVRVPHLFYGGGSIRVRSLIHDNNATRVRTLHTFTPDNTPAGWADGPPFDQPNLPIRFESNSLSGGAVRANAAHYERGESGAETRINGEHIETVDVTTSDWTPLISWRKRTGWESVNVRPLNVAVEAAGNDVELELQLNPVLDGNESFGLPVHTSSDETSVEVATNNGNTYSITTDGERRWLSFAIAGQGNQSGEATASKLDFSLPNDQIVTLAAQSVGGSATVSGFVALEEFF